MPGMPRRRKTYFTPPADAPPPLVMRVTRRIQFSDVDPMAVLWHGRYTQLFEQASEALGHHTGMTYEAMYRAGLRAPIVQLHVDYFASVLLAETVTITARLVWNDAARMDTEYEVHRESGELAATGYTVQMFVTETGSPLLAPPPLQLEIQRQWRAGQLWKDQDA